MRLYMLATCPYAHRAAYVLREKKVGFDVVFFERGKRPPELEAIGSRARSPTLFDGQARIYDSGVVLEYLEERFPAPRLLPADLAERAEARALIVRYNEEIGTRYGALIKSVREGGDVSGAKQAFLDALPPWNAYLAGRRFAVGQSLTLADITLYTLFPSVKRHANLEIPSELSHLRQWHDTMRARPAAPIPEPP